MTRQLRKAFLKQVAQSQPVPATEHQPSRGYHVTSVQKRADASAHEAHRRQTWSLSNHVCIPRPSVCTYKLPALVRRVELQESPQMLGATWVLCDSGWNRLCKNYFLGSSTLGLSVKITFCSCYGPEFSSQNLRLEIHYVLWLQLL